MSKPQPMPAQRQSYVKWPVRTLAGLLLLVAGVAASGCGASRDYLVVIDTSGSMARDRLLEQVKGGVKRLLDETIRDGDSVALFTFDEQLEPRGVYAIGDKDARVALLKTVEGLTPLPKNTDMVALILHLRAASRAAEKKGREQVIVVLSDGEDAPDPRAKSRPRLDIGRFRAGKAFPVQAKYIYYVSLRNQENARVIEGLEKAIGGRVTSVKVAQAKDGSAAAGGAVSAVSSIGGDLRQQEITKFALAYWPYLAAVLGLCLLLLLALIVRGRYRRANHPEGFLLYYEDGIQSPMKSVFRLDRIQSNQFVLGGRTGADFRVRGLGITDLIPFSSRREKDRCRLKPAGGSAAQVQPLVQKDAGFYQFGDRFKIGSYIFEYSETQE